MGKMRGAIVVNIEACKGCQLCVAACPAKILALAPAKVNHKGYPYVEMTDWEKCTGCASYHRISQTRGVELHRKILLDYE